MKTKNTLKVLLLVAAVFAGSLSAFAKGKVAVVPYLRTNYTLIAAESGAEEFRSVAIIDKFGETLFSTNRVVSDAVFSKVFDFSKLSDGDYKVRLHLKSGTSLEASFKLENGGVASKSFSEISTASEDDVRIWSDKDFLFVSHLNRTMRPAVVVVKDSRGSIVYNNTLPTDLTYSGKYSVAALPKGDYIISLESASKVYSYEFRK